MAADISFYKEIKCQGRAYATGLSFLSLDISIVFLILRNKEIDRVKLSRYGMVTLLIGAIAIALFSGIKTQAWAQTDDKSVIDKVPEQDPLPNEEQKMIPAEDSIHMLSDSAMTTIPQPDSVTKPVLIEEPADSFLVKEELPLKSFRGSGQDVILGAITIVGWLVFMWFAANQGPN